METFLKYLFITIKNYNKQWSEKEVVAYIMLMALVAIVYAMCVVKKFYAGATYRCMFDDVQHLEYACRYVIYKTHAVFIKILFFIDRGHEGCFCWKLFRECTPNSSSLCNLGLPHPIKLLN